MIDFKFVLVYIVTYQCFIIKCLGIAIFQNDSAETKLVPWHVFLLKFEDFKTRLWYVDINIQ